MISRFQHPLLRAVAGALVLLLLLLDGAAHRESPDEPISDVECVLCATGGHAGVVAPVIVLPAPTAGATAPADPLVLSRANPAPLSPSIRGPPLILLA